MRRGDPVSIWNTTAVETEPSQNSAVEGRLMLLLLAEVLLVFRPLCIVLRKGFHVTFLKPVKLGLVGRGAMLV